MPPQVENRPNWSFSAIWQQSKAKIRWLTSLIVRPFKQDARPNHKRDAGTSNIFKPLFPMKFRMIDTEHSTSELSRASGVSNP